MRNNFYSILSVVLILFSSSVFSAEIYSRLIDSDGDYFLVIKGEIIEGDYNRFLNNINKHRAFPTIIWLSSPGGDVLEAIKIGRVIRDGVIETGLGIPDSLEDTCSSSCFLIWSAGVRRPSYP